MRVGSATRRANAPWVCGTCIADPRYVEAGARLGRSAGHGQRRFQDVRGIGVDIALRFGGGGLDVDDRRRHPVVVGGFAPLTGTGVAGTLATGAYTAAFAVLQYLGVRRLA